MKPAKFLYYYNNQLVKKILKSLVEYRKLVTE